DGGFVALTEFDEKVSFGGYTPVMALAAFDSLGRKRWSVDDRGSADSALFAPESVTVTTSHQIAVLGNIDDKLRIYTIDGRHVRTVDLNKVWGRNANYPSGIHADISGGVIVNDFDGNPPIVRMTPDG